jgi:cytochrome b involved in lipid metabolism
MSKSLSVSDVASHKDADSGMYIIVDENVYDVTGMFLLSLCPHRPSCFAG